MTCLKCNKEVKINVTNLELLNWKAGLPAQIAFPKLNPDERELLISGICGKCYDELFGEFQ
jgi:hypothetical protein